MQHVNTHVTTNADTWRAPIVLGPLMVLTFNILSCVILIRWVGNSERGQRIGRYAGMQGKSLGIGEGRGNGR